MSKHSNIIPIGNPVHEIRGCANTGGKSGPPKEACRANGRADVTIWNDDEEWHSKAIIEVKKAWSWDAKKHGVDIDRICALLLNTGINSTYKGTIEYGIFVIITDVGDEKHDEKLVKTSLNKIYKRMKEIIVNYINNKSDKLKCKSFKKHGSYHKEEGMMSVFVFKIIMNT